MPLQRLQFNPGINREGTSLSNEGGWYDCDKVRFRSGLPEKIGGWSALSYNTFQGVARSLLNWITLRGYNLMGVGTNLKFYVEYGTNYNDITPIRKITGPGASPPTGGPTFAATTGSTSITVTDTGIGSFQAGDFVTYSGAVSLGGAITANVLNKEYQIATVISSTQYTIVSAVQATAGDSGNGGGSVTAKYQLSVGSAITTSGTGWGAGPWPPYLTTTLTDPFTASGTGVSVLNVNQVAHGLVTGDYVYFLSIASDPCGINRLVLEKAFQITRVDADNYTISTVIENITYTTTSSAASGGTVVVYYPNPTVIASYDRGWGDGFAIGINQQLRLWSQSNFGEKLLISPRGGAFYEWDPGAGITPAFTVPAQLVSGFDVPSKINQIMVSDQTRITICFGTNSYGAYDSTDLDPMLIRWSDQEDYTVWTDTETNQAGSYRLSHGSLIIGAIQTRQEINIWTDAAIYSMQYLGPPYVWGFTLLSDNISIASPNAMITAAGAVFWMGIDKFYVYSGRVETLPCSVRTYVYSDINRTQLGQVFAGTNEGYSEIWWFYCSANSDTIDRYVIYNYLDRVWYYGSMSRTAWIDSSLRDYPMAATSNNLLVFHEAAVDDGTTNPPSPISSYIQSSDFDIGEGNNYSFVSRILPDITFNNSNTSGLTVDRPSVHFTIRPRQNPGAPYGVTDDPTVAAARTQTYKTTTTYNVQEFTQIIYTRVRGRQMSFRVSSDTEGTQWQLGVPRIDIRSDGRR